MAKLQNRAIQLFCSYSHKDDGYLESLEECLSNLERSGDIVIWHDRKIMPGTNISKTVIEKMNEAEIFVFLLSSSYLSSKECIKEWEKAFSIERKGKLCVRVPIIVRDCDWLELLGTDNIKALPKDGRSIVSYSNQDQAWREVCEGIRAVVTDLKNRFIPKNDFIESIELTEFSSDNPLKLNDIYVFPCISLVRDYPNDISVYEEKAVLSIKEILSFKNALIHGEDMSGKTALLRMIFFHLIEEGKPALYFDLQNTFGHPSEKTFRQSFFEQFNGDYEQWVSQDSAKTIIIDGLSFSKRDRKFLEVAIEKFDNVIVCSSTSVYRSYYWDDSLVAQFKKLELGPITHVVQERLIRKRLQLMNLKKSVKDGHVDQIESKVNSIIQSEIVPRYPFYVLSVIQTLEAYMPKDFNITSYGHCYYALILARLIKSGIAKSDDSLNVCLQFAERLAIVRYKKEVLHSSEFAKEDFLEFVSSYREKYVLPDSILSSSCP